MSNCSKVAALLIAGLFVLMPSFMSISAFQPTSIVEVDKLEENCQVVISSSQGNVTNVKYWNDKVIPTGKSEMCFNDMIQLSGNLTVENGGSLWLENTTLKLNGSYPFNYVNISGELLLTRGTMISHTGTGNYNFTIFPQAIGTISESSFENIGSNNLLILSSSLEFRKVLFSTTSLYVENTTLSLSECLLRNSLFGLITFNSTVSLSNTTIDNTVYCIATTASTLILGNSTISSYRTPNSYDILVNDSRVNCINTTFSEGKLKFSDNKSVVTKEWFVSVHVDSANGPVPNATVTAKASGVTKALNYTTDATGWLRFINYTEYELRVQNQSNVNKTTRNPYRFTISAIGYLPENMELNITSNIIIPKVLKERYPSKWMYRNEDWRVNRTEIAENQIMLLSGNLTIEGGGLLTLSNFTLLMNCTSNGTYQITIKNGSTLRVISSSSIQSYNTSLRYDMLFEPGSSGRIADSLIESVGYPGGRSRGLEIDDALVELYSSEIRSCYFGLYAIDSNLHSLFNDRIHNNDADGIYVYNSSLSTVSGEVYSNGKCGIRGQNSTITVTETTIKGNGLNSLYSANSSVIMRKTNVYSNNGSVSLENSTCSFTENNVFDQKEGIQGKLSTIYMGMNRINNTFAGVFLINSSLEMVNNNMSYTNSTAVSLIKSIAEITGNTFYQCGYSLNIEDTVANITRNNILLNTFEGIQITGTNLKTNTSISQNLIMNVTGAGILVQDSNLSKSSISENRIIYNNYGISCTKSVLNVRNNTITNNSWYGLYSKESVVASRDNFFSQVDYDLYITERSSVVTENDTFSKNNTFVDASSSWTVSWHVWVSVTDRYGTPTNNSALVVRDNMNGTFKIMNTTNSAGITQMFTCIEFKVSSGIMTNYNPYNITASREWNGTYITWLDIFIMNTTTIHVSIPGLNLPPRPVHLEEPDYITDKSTYLRWSSPLDIDLQNKTFIYAYRINGINVSGLKPVVVINSTSITTVFVNDLYDNTDYSFRIRIMDFSGQYADSNEVTIRTKEAPPHPVVLMCSNITYYSVNLTWTQTSITDFQRYEVHYSTFWNLTNYSIAPDPIYKQNITNFTVIGLDEHTLYFFRVRVFDTANYNISMSFADSNIVAVMTGIKNHRPNLFSPKVTPERGYTTTRYKFTVTYQDQDNDNPNRPSSSGYIRVNISGQQYDMVETDSTDDNFNDGKDYQFILPYPPAGIYDYYFDCNDGAEKFNFTYKTDPLHFTVEKPREILFADMVYSAIVVMLAALVFILLFFLWEEKRKTRGRVKRTIPRLPGIREVGESIKNRKERSIQREKSLSRDSFAKTGIPDRRLKEITAKPSHRDMSVIEEESTSEVSVRFESVGTEASETTENYCGKCGAVIKMRICGFCGASQKKYLLSERVPSITRIILLILYIVPIAVAAVALFLVYWKGGSYFYPNHTFRLVYLIGLFALAVVLGYITLRLRTRVRQIGRYGLMKCPTCGGKINSKSRFCRHCGRNVTFLRTLLG